MVSLFIISEALSHYIMLASSPAVFNVTHRHCKNGSGLGHSSLLPKYFNVSMQKSVKTDKFHKINGSPHLMAPL
jgi:hypothetical protein